MIAIRFHVKIDVCNNMLLQKERRKYGENASSRKFIYGVKNAIHCHYNELITRCGVDTIYGYFILTDDGVNSIGPVANKERSIKVDKWDPLYNYYRSGAVKWSEWDDFGMFDEVNTNMKPSKMTLTCE